MSTQRELTADDWLRLNALLATALEFEPAQREAWVAALPPDAQDLKPLLTELLGDPAAAASDATSETLRPVADLAAAALSAMRAEQAGDRVGPWRLVRLLAEGGMGAVWVAERADGVMQRRAALKLPRAEWVDHGLTQRIARERAILARLQHPHIAVLYDAGLADGGRPYLALEYVDGVPIDAWCATRDLRSILRIMVQVARAVAHAHGQLVIHRDLKPANVLVTADGAPKLLDFGISKLIEGDATAAADATALTRLAGRPLTLAYAAPEQVLGLPVTVTADVYALGVMLFELLTGTRLYRSTAPRELEAEMLRGDLRRPSDAAADAARARALRGDLDAIVATALKRNAAERYASAAAFADDLERYLGGHPVQARPDTRAYRLGKFLHRNALPVAAAAAITAALGIGLAAAVWQANEAREQAARATALNTFVLGLIRTADPAASRQTRDADLAMLHSIEERIEHDFKGSPDQLLQLRSTVAEAYRNRGELVSAQRLMQRAVEEASRHLKADDLLLLAAQVNASDPAIIVSSAAARQLQQAVDVLRTKAAGSREAAALLIDALLWQMDLAGFYGLPEYPSPEYLQATLQEALQLATTRFGNGSLQHLKAATPYATLLLMRQTPQQARDFLAPILAQAAASGNSAMLDSIEYATARAQHAALTCAAGEPREGLDVLWDLIAKARANHGEGSYLSESLMLSLGTCLQAAGDATNAAIPSTVFDIASRREQPPSPNLLRRAMDAFNFALGMRDMAGAERYYQAVQQNLAAIEEPELQDRLTMGVRLSRICQLVQRGEAAEAERLARPLIAGFNAEFGKIRRLTPNQGGIWICTSHALRELERYDEAIQIGRTYMERCIALRRIAPGANCDARALSVIALAELEAGRLDRAREAVEQRLQRVPEYDHDPSFVIALARVRLADGHSSEALEVLRRSYGGWLSMQPNSPFAAEVLYWLGKALVATGDARGQRFVEQARRQLTDSPVASHRRLAAGTTPGS